MDNESEYKKEQKKEKPLNELLTSTIADIYVGPESTHWPLHERLLCYYSPFFSSIFYADDKSADKKKSSGNKSYGLPDEDDLPFELLVGWLYSRAIRAPKSEKDIGPLLDLYLLAEKFEMKKLSLDVVECVREHYHSTSTYPGLRRVQFIYAETEEDNEMREMMVGSIARQLTTADKIPAHWAKALQRNGQLAVDIIRAIQQWHIEERSIPDARDGSQTRGRHANGGGFSAVEREGADSVETVDTNLGVESLNSGASAGVKSDEEPSTSSTTPTPAISSPFTSPLLPPEPPPSPPLPAAPRLSPKRNQPPDKSKVVVFVEEDIPTATTETEKSNEKSSLKGDVQTWNGWLQSHTISRPETAFLLMAWIAFLTYHVFTYNRS